MNANDLSCPVCHTQSLNIKDDRLRCETCRSADIEQKDYPDYIGIDFGTSNSVIAFPWNNAFQLVTIEKGSKPTQLIPSILYKDCETSEFCIGLDAQEKSIRHPENALRSMKLLMDSQENLSICGETYLPKYFAQEILKKLLEFAKCHYFKKEKKWPSIQNAIVTVPTCFHDDQINVINNAGKNIGLNFTDTIHVELNEDDDRVINGQSYKEIKGEIFHEPTAAAFYYLNKMENDRRLPDNKNEIHLLIFDYGGGTLDVSVVQFKHFENVHGPRGGVLVLANKGSDEIGGEVLTLRLMKLLLDRFENKIKELKPGSDSSISSVNDLISKDYKYVFDSDKMDDHTRGRLLWSRAEWFNLAEQKKIELSKNESVTFRSKDLSVGIFGIEDGKVVPVVGVEDLEFIITRVDFDNVIQKELSICEDLIEKVIDDAGIAKENIDYVIHTGQVSYMPSVQSLINRLFPSLQGDGRILIDEDVKFCVAKGAALIGKSKNLPGSRNIAKPLEKVSKLPHAYGYAEPVDASRTKKKFVEVIPIGQTCPHEVKLDTSQWNIPSGSTIQFEVYKNWGKSNSIDEENSEIRRLGKGEIKIDNPNVLEIVFKVGRNCKLKEVTVNGEFVPIDEQDGDDGKLSEHLRWWGYA